MRSILVWDLPTRVFHWLLVACVAVAWLTGGEEESIRLHAAAGYTVALLVLWRLVWGLIGSRYARFASFLFSPAKTAEFAAGLVQGQPKRYIGHNPVGSLAIIGFLLLGLAIPLFGHLALQAEEPGLALGGGGVVASAQVAAPEVAAAREDEEAEEGEEHGGMMAAEGDEAGEVWEEAHEAAANAILLLIIIHVLGVVLENKLLKENLTKAMVTGHKEGAAEDAIPSAHVPMGALLVLLVVGFQLFYWLR